MFLRLITFIATYYTFTYEINRLTGTTINNEDQAFEPYYTWNYLNSGGNNPSSIDYGLDILINNGAPTGEQWEGAKSELTYWMTGYDLYFSSSENKAVSYTWMEIDNENDLNNLKHWIADHNEGADVGGVAPFYTYMYTGSQYETIPPESPYQSGQNYLKNLGTTGKHAMTFVGYNDYIYFEIDADGTFTNNEDNNGDGEIDMRDWEIGGLKVANSWGEDWTNGNLGFIWLPYYLLMEPKMGKIFMLTCEEPYTPEFTAKIKITHPVRDEIRIYITASEDPFASPPTSLLEYHRFEGIWFKKGGEFPLLGYGNYSPLELEFDISSLLENVSDPHCFFLRLRQYEGNFYPDAEIIEFSIVDRRGDEPFEVYCHQSNVPINQVDNYMIIDYNILPNTIPIQTQLIDYNCIIKENTLIQGGTVDFNCNYIDFYDGGILKIASGATTNFIHEPCEFSAQRGVGTLLLEGQANFNQFAKFKTRYNIKSPTDYFDISLKSADNNYNFFSSSFSSTYIHGGCNVLSFNYCTFENSDIDLQDCNIDISNNCNFFISSIKASAKPDYYYNYIHIDECNFNISGSFNDIIYIENYDNFSLTNNQISNGVGNGIYLFNAGHGTGENYVKYNSLISNCGILETYGAGVCLYNSYAEIEQNSEITGNLIGIKLYNNSDGIIKGNKLANYVTETQQIIDNEYNQIFITPGSSPWYCHWNAIIDEDNISPLYYVDVSPDGDVSGIDARWNYWGNNFNPLEDLSPGIEYEPVWNLSYGERTQSETELLYLSAWEMVEDSNYIDAQNTFKQVVNLYPDSLLAKTSLKDLYGIEDESGGVYDSLIIYYETELTIQADSTLRKLADFLISMCEIKLEHYQEAIDRFDSIIQNPESMQDSIFAIIDLAYVYQLMQDSSSRNIYIGKFPQYIYSDYKSFAESREYHLNLLHNDNIINKKNPKNENISEISLECYPNPFKRQLFVNISTKKQSYIEVVILNSIGQIIKKSNSFAINNKTNFEFNFLNYSNGIYFVVAKIDGVIKVSEKIIKSD